MKEYASLRITKSPLNTLLVGNNLMAHTIVGTLYIAYTVCNLENHFVDFYGSLSFYRALIYSWRLRCMKHYSVAKENRAVIMPIKDVQKKHVMEYD